MLIIFIRTIIIYSVVLFALRMMGKSELSKMSTFQMVVLFMIAELASMPIDDPTSSLLNGIMAILTLLFLQITLSLLSLKFEGFKNFVNGKPSIIIEHGKINVNEMSKLRITINDLFEQLRIEDCPSPSDVEYAVMESNGELSVLSKDDQSKLPLILICDGYMYKENLKKVKDGSQKVNSILSKHGLKVEDIFLAYSDSHKEIHIYKFPNSNHKFAQELL